MYSGSEDLWISLLVRRFVYVRTLEYFIPMYLDVNATEDYVHCDL